MPYIVPEAREPIDLALRSIELEFDKLSRGDMNYLISKLIHRWVDANRQIFTPAGYQLRSDGHSILVDAAAEFYRTVLAPYEDLKRRENGSVSDLDR